MAEHIKIGDITPWEQTVQTVAGNKEFQFHFPIFRDEDLEVFVDDAGPLALGTDYTVAGVGSDDGGTLTVATAPAMGARVTRRRRIAIQRTSDFQDSGEFRAKVLNDELDYQTAAIQQVALDIARSLVTAPTDPAGNLTLPAIADRKGYYWLWDPATGDPSLSSGTADAPVSAEMAAVVAAASVAAARALLGAEPADGDIVKTDTTQQWDADAGQYLDGTADIGSLDELDNDTYTIDFTRGPVQEIDADVDGTIAAPSTGYGIVVLYIYNNATRSLTLSGFPTDALNGGELSGTDTKIDVIAVARSNVNGTDIIDHWIMNRA